MNEVTIEELKLQESLKTIREEQYMENNEKQLHAHRLDSEGWIVEIAVSWRIDDVLMTARTMGVPITKTQARKVLWFLHTKHDAEVGINWNVIEHQIEKVVKGKEQ